LAEKPSTPLTLNEKEVLEAIREIKSKIVVSIHYEFLL